MLALRRLPGEPTATLQDLDDLAAGRRIHIVMTIPYHVRSAEPLSERYDAEIERGVSR